MMDEKKELNELVELADKAYEDGKYEEAFELYEKAGVQGCADAQNNLGKMYRLGNGVEQDYRKALEWYLKSAEMGNASAQCNIGVMYANGIGVEQNYEKALEWYLKSAEMGNASAQYNLGIMYEKGEGVEQDFIKACVWYKRAVAQGYEKAKKALRDIKTTKEREKKKDELICYTSNLYRKEYSKSWNGFQDYLVECGYKLYTPSGLPSTVFEYRRAVSDIKSNEALSFSDFCNNIDSIIREYDIGGSKESLGKKKHSTWINALKRFREYLHFIRKM